MDSPTRPPFGATRWRLSPPRAFEPSPPTCAGAAAPIDRPLLPTTRVGDVTGIMDALGIRRAHVVGHDWGAAVASGDSTLAPGRVGPLVAFSAGAARAA